MRPAAPAPLPRAVPLYAVWDAPRAADAAPSSSSSSSAAAVGITFCCRGRVQLPPRGLAARGGLLGALALLLLAAAAFAATAAAGAAAALGAGATAAAGALIAAASLALLLVVVGDPGVLPRHATALRGLVDAALAPPAGAQLLRAAAEAPAAEARALGDAPLVAASAALAAVAAPRAAATLKFCVTCRIWRPPGAHHCSRCNVCVAGFDHHCDFIGKCVGSGNARAFLIMLWTFAAASAAGLAYALAAALSAIVRAAAADADFAAELPLWAAGGGLLGAATLAMLCLPAALAGGRTVWCLVAAGAAALLAGFGRAAGPDLAAPAVPALIAVPVFLGLLGLVSGLAVSFSCTFAARRTTKAELAAKRAAASVAKSAAAAVAAVVAAGDGGAGAAVATPAADASATIVAPPLSARLASLLRLLLTPAPQRMVDFTADVSELAAAVRAFEKAAFLRAVAASQPGAAPLDAEPLPPGCDWRTIEALRASVDNNFFHDVIAIGEACRAAEARPVLGVVVGSKFLLPGVEMSLAPPAPF